ncbi:MAG: hypothetical protein ACFFCW_38645, partial [Candidatus Hodarchaeota archaeon]
LGAILYFSRILFPENLFAMTIFGTVVGSLIIGVLYWRFILPKGLRSRITHFIKSHTLFFKKKMKHASGY